MIEVILLERVDRLGALGDVVKVRPGFARNFLLPQKKALRATKSNLVQFETRKAELAAKNEAQKSDAEKAAKKLTGLTLLLIRQASESGQLYGSVTARDIVDAAETKGVTIQRAWVEFAKLIKSVGIYQVVVKLHPDVAVTIQVIVARSAEDSEKLQKDERKAKEAAEAAAAAPALAQDAAGHAEKAAKKAKKAAEALENTTAEDAGEDKPKAKKAKKKAE